MQVAALTPDAISFPANLCIHQALRLHFKAYKRIAVVGKKSIKRKENETSEAVADASSSKLFRDFVAGSLPDNLSAHCKDPAGGRILFQLDQLFLMALPWLPLL